VKTILTIATVVSFAFLSSVSGARAEDYRLSNDQLDAVTAAGGQIASIGPAKAKAAKSALPKRGVKRQSAGRGFF
jgi:hypothetical protein